MFVIATKLAFLQVKQESFSGYSVEFSQSPFGKIPKVFNAIDARSFSVGIRFGMIDPVMLVAVKNKSVITSPFIRVDGGFLFDDLLNNRQKR